MDTNNIIQHTRNWLSGFIIPHNICPFAKREYDRDSIQYTVIDSADLEQQLHALISACAQLDQDTDVETALLIFPQGLDDFDNYLDFLAMANELLHQQHYQGVYQLASFHPDYQFDGVAADDASNFTNRSPYPTLHLIREASLELALESYPEPEKIPLRNIEYTRQLGKQALVEILQNCKK